MLDIFSSIEQWTAEQKEFALATVIYTWGSAPRLVGAAMAISKDMEISGSVSGGCVEGAVMQEAEEVITSGIPKVLKFGISNDDAWAIGLSCGGKLGVFVEKFLTSSSKAEEQKIWKAIQAAVHENHGCVLLSRMVGDHSAHTLVYPNGTILGENLSKDLFTKALEAYKQRKNQIIEHENGDYFAHVIPRKNQLLVIGAAHISVDLVHLAKHFGFETILVDPRGIFTNKTQFTTAPDHMHEKWPKEVLNELPLDAYTYAVMLTHDPKVDDQALHILLKSDVAYIGALGSKRTHKKRVDRLEKAGFSEAEIARIHGPIGLNINAKLPREIALSILAQIIQIKNQYL